MTDQVTVDRIAALEREIEMLRAQENPNNRDPIYADLKTRHFLSQTPGQRWWMANMNGNGSYGSPVPSLTFNNFTDAAKYDVTRRYQYLHLDVGASEFMKHDATTDPGWGIWGHDSGAGVWPEVSRRGITFGAWFNCDSIHTTEMGVISGWNAQAGHAAWRMLVDTVTNADKLRCSISNTGSYDATQEVVGTLNITTGKWYLGVARLKISTEIKLWLFDGDEVDVNTNTTSIVSSTYDSKYLYVGSYKRSTGNDDSFDGKIGHNFFFVNAWTDAEVQTFFDVSRHIYGV